MGNSFDKSEKGAATGYVTPAVLNCSTTQHGHGQETSIAARDLVQAAEEEFTEDQYRKLVWKIDLVILPLMWVSCSQPVSCPRSRSHVDAVPRSPRRGRKNFELLNLTKYLRPLLDMRWYSVCGQSFAFHSGDFRLEGKYKSGRAAIFMYDGCPILRPGNSQGPCQILNILLLTLDTGLTTIFYLAYLVAEGPGNFILQRFHLGRTVSICMLLWVSIYPQECNFLSGLNAGRRPNKYCTDELTSLRESLSYA